MKCNQCQFENLADARFCTRCGANLGGKSDQKRGVRPEPMAAKPGPQSSPKPRRRLPMWAWAAISLTVLLCLLMGVFLILPTDESSQPQERKVIQTQTAMLDRGGGTFQMGSLELNVGPSQLENPVSLTLTEYETGHESGVRDQTNLFEVEGIPLDFNGTIQAALDIPEHMLNALESRDAQAADQLMFYVGSYHYVPSQGGFTFLMAPEEAEIDLASGRAVLTVFEQESLGMAGRKIAAVEPLGLVIGEEQIGQAGNMGLMQTTDKSDDIDKIDNKIAFRLYSASDYSTSMFRLTSKMRFSAGKFTRLLRSFNWVRNDLGLPHDIVMNVEIVELPDGALGSFSVSKLTGRPLIRLDPIFVESGDDLQRAIIGHEMMHLQQNRIRGRWGWGLGEANTWRMLDEAVATWYEQHASGNPGYLPGNAIGDNIIFFRRPWLWRVCGGYDSESDGYGASWFIRYLVNENNREFLTAVYQAEGVSSGGEALQKGIEKALGQDIRDLYQQFLVTYILKPENIAPNLNTAPYHETITKGGLYRLVLEADGNRLNFNGNQVHRFGREPVTVTTEPGQYIVKEGQPAVIEKPPTVLISADTKGSLQAFYFRFDVPKSGELGQIEADITIESAGGPVVVFRENTNGKLEEITEQATGVSKKIVVNTRNLNQLHFFLFNNTELFEQIPVKVNVFLTYGSDQPVGLGWEGTWTIIHNFEKFNVGTSSHPQVVEMNFDNLRRSGYGKTIRIYADSSETVAQFAGRAECRNWRVPCIIEVNFPNIMLHKPSYELTPEENRLYYSGYDLQGRYDEQSDTIRGTFRMYWVQTGEEYRGTFTATRKNN